MTLARILATLGLVLIVTVAVAVTHRGAPTTAGNPTAESPVLLPEPSSPAAPTGLAIGDGSPSEPETTVPPVLRVAPALKRLDGWLQSDISSLEELRGQVVILQFWTFGCSNCKATLPHLEDIYATYRDRGLEIVGVHSPEFDFEKDPDSILDAAIRLGVTWPIALDTSKLNFHAWQEGATAYWPRTYVIDQQGRIRFDHIGEGGYDDLEATVAALLAA